MKANKAAPPSTTFYSFYSSTTTYDLRITSPGHYTHLSDGVREVFTGSGGRLRDQW